MHDLLYTLLRTTLFLTVCGGVCFISLRKIETRLPRLSRFLWLAVLLTGWVWLQPAIQIPHLAGTPRSPVETPTPPVEMPLYEEIPRQIDTIPAPPMFLRENFPIESPTAVEILPEAKTFDWKLLMMKSVFAVWLGGIFLTIMLAATGYVRILLLLRNTVSADDDFAGPWRRLLSEYGIKEKKIPMLLSKNLGPALIRTPLGYRLAIPDELWSELSESGRLAVLQHELAHFRRRDVWKSFFVRILALPHWFNPVAHYAANRFDELAEQLCYREAFLGKREGVTEFARTLLLMHENAPTHFVARQSIFGRDLKRRVAVLLEANSLRKVSAMKKTLLILGTAAMLCAALFRVEFVAKTSAEQNVVHEPGPVVPTSGKYLWTTVIDIETKKPFAGVKATLKYFPAGENEQRTLETVSDAEGRVFLPPLVELAAAEDKVCTIRIEKEKYVPIEWNTELKYLKEGFENGEPAFPAKAELAEATLLKGRFVSESGKSVPNVSIMVACERKYENPPSRTLYSRYDSCDEKGEFEIPVDKGAETAFLVRHKDFVFKRFVTKKEEDRRGEIPLGDIVLKSGFRPTIQVLDKDGKPVDDVWVTLTLAASQKELDSKTKNPSSFVDSESVLTDAEGKAMFAPAEAGDYFAEIVKAPWSWPFNREKDSTSRINSLAKPVKGVYETAAIMFSPSSQTATIRAKKTVKVTVQFSDNKTSPDREQWLFIEGGDVGFHVVEAYSSSSSRYRGNYLGEGRFLFEVPEKLRDAKLVLKQEGFSSPKIDNEISYRCSVDGKEATPPAYPLNFPLRDLDTDRIVEITCIKSPKITLRVFDEEGKPVKEYFAAAQYSKRGQTITFTQDETTMTSRGYRRWGADAHVSSWANVSGERCPELGMDVEFSWRDFGNDAAKINNEGILSNEDMQLYVVGKGYDVFEQKIPKMTGGEERELTVTLKKSPQPIIPKADSETKTNEKVTGRVVDEDGKPLEGVRVKVAYPYYLDGDRKNETKTNADGRFVFTGPFYFTYEVENDKTVKINRPAFEFFVPGRERQSRTLEKNSSEVHLVLRRGVQVQGRVIDARTGKPAPDAMVYFCDTKDPGSLARNEQAVRADHLGDYTIPSFLPPGRYNIVGEAWLDDGPAWGKLESVDVSLENQTFHAPDLHVDRCGWVESEFVGPQFSDTKTGQRIFPESVNVLFVGVSECQSRLRAMPPQSLIGSKVKLPVFPGENKLLFMNPRPFSIKGIDNVKIVNAKPGETVKLKFEVELPQRLKERIVEIPTGRTVVFRTLPRLTEEEEKINVDKNLAWEDLFRFENGNWIDVKTGENVQGVVRLREGKQDVLLGKADGKGKITITEENGKTGSYDAAAVGTIIPPASKPVIGEPKPATSPEAPKKITDKKTYDEVNGRVADGNDKPIEGVLVKVEYPDSKDADKITETRTNADGRFTLKGPFHLETFRENGKPVGWVAPSLVFLAEGKAWLKVQISDQSNEMNAVLLPGARLQGRVIDDRTGKGAANTTVRFCDMNALNNLLQLNRDTKTDAEGNYRTAFGLRPGRYVVFVLDEDDPKNETLGKIEPVEVRLGNPVFQVPDLHVDQCGWIKGSFVDAETGEPVAMHGVNIDHVCTSPNKFRKVFDRQVFLMASGTTFKARAFPGENMLRLVGGGAGIIGLDNYCTKTMNIKPGETVSLKFEVIRNVTVEALGKLPEPVEEEREAAAAVKRLGGWYKVDANKHVVEVNMSSRNLDDVYYTNPQRETDAVMPVLGKFSRLKSLVIRDGQVTNESAKYLAELTQLESLYWGNCRIGDAGAAQLEGLKKLRIIHIDYAKLTDASLKVFAELPELRELWLCGNAFTNHGLESLCEAKNLEKLWWCHGKTKPNDASLKILAGFPNLREVEIQGADITTAGFESLSTSPSLKKISFEWPDDEKHPNSQQLSESLAKLKTLEVFSSVSVDFSEDEARTVARALPKLKELGKWNAEQLERLRE